MSQTLKNQSPSLKRDELHAEGLAALDAGERVKAKSLLSKALIDNPGDALSHSYVAYAMMLDNEYEAAHILYSKAVEIDPNLALAYHGLAGVHEQMGDAAGAEKYRVRGLRLRPITTLRYTGKAKPIEVLLLGALGSHNIDTKRFFDPQLFRVHALAVEYFPPMGVLPPFDYCFNAIGEADSAQAALQRARQILAPVKEPIFNHPDIVLRTGRIAMSQLLSGISGVRTPKIVRLGRQLLAPAELASTLETQGFSYPFLLRSPGHHQGMHFVQVTRAEDVQTALLHMPGNEFFAIEFFDARGADRLIRKYRVIAIDGELYPIHLAIATHWKVHYFSSETDRVAAYREEEARFLEHMPNVLGAATMTRLRGIMQLLGLDYGGIDFSMTADGTLFVYEANATMGFIEPPVHATQEYRRPAMQRAKLALDAMLRKTV